MRLVISMSPAERAGSDVKERQRFIESHEFRLVKRFSCTVKRDCKFSFHKAERARNSFPLHPRSPDVLLPVSLFTNSTARELYFFPLILETTWKCVSRRENVNTRPPFRASREKDSETFNRSDDFVARQRAPGTTCFARQAGRRSLVESLEMLQRFHCLRGKLDVLVTAQFLRSFEYISVLFVSLTVS